MAVHCFWKMSLSVLIVRRSVFLANSCLGYNVALGPVQTFQRCKELEVQCSSSGMAARTPFWNGPINASFSQSKRLCFICLLYFVKVQVGGNMLRVLLAFFNICVKAIGTILREACHNTTFWRSLVQMTEKRALKLQWKEEFLMAK